MMMQEMTERECYHLLADAHVARLGCAHDNQPYIVPIHVDFEDGYLYSFAMAGQKIEWMRQNPLVCVQVDQLSTQMAWTSVVASGSYEELSPTAAHAELRSVAERLFQRHPMWWEPASVQLPGEERRVQIVFRIRVNRVSGRRATPSRQPDASVELNTVVTSQGGWFVHLLRFTGQR